VKVALDTNVLAYAEGVNAGDRDDRREAAIEIVRALPQDAGVLPVQALGELFNILVRKARRSRADARTAILGWRDAFPVVATSAAAMFAAADLAADHELGIWDALILCSAAEAECRLLLSEDLQEGFTWAGVTVTNPFSVTRHPLLDALLTA
jgi:predicted nucleic acid-binding protein